MPIQPVHAVQALCDLCPRHLLAASDAFPSTPNVPALFHSTQDAVTAAHRAGWCVGRQLLACPNCSPISAPHQPPTPGAHPTNHKEA